MLISTAIINGLAVVGACTIADKVIVPAAKFTGMLLGKGYAKLLNKVFDKAEEKAKAKRAVKSDCVKEDDILNLIRECKA